MKLIIGYKRLLQYNGLPVIIIYGPPGKHVSTLYLGIGEAALYRRVHEVAELISYPDTLLKRIKK